MMGMPGSRSDGGGMDESETVSLAPLQRDFATISEIHVDTPSRLLKIKAGLIQTGRRRMRKDREKINSPQGGILKSLALYLLTFSLGVGTTALTYGGHIFVSTGPCDKESYTPGERISCWTAAGCKSDRRIPGISVIWARAWARVPTLGWHVSVHSGTAGTDGVVAVAFLFNERDNLEKDAMDSETCPP